MTSRDPERSSRDPNTLKAQYHENRWRWYLATAAANYQLVCCEAVRVGYPSDSLASCYCIVTRTHAEDEPDEVRVSVVADDDLVVLIVLGVSQETQLTNG